MSSREITLWIDDCWADALEKHLPGHDLQRKMEELLNELTGQLPEQVRESISREIRAEAEFMEQEREASRRFSVLKVTEDGKDRYLVSESGVDLLNVASAIRRCLNGETRGPSLSVLPRMRECDSAEFRAAVMERVENTGRVVGAFMVDMDAGKLSTLNENGGWHQYNFRDLSAAAYAAHRKSQERYERKLEIFAEKLRGRELNPAPLPVELSSSRPLAAEDFRIENIRVEPNARLEFSLQMIPGIDGLFGTHIMSGNDKVSVQASYDLAAGQTVDCLKVSLYRSDGAAIPMKYRLNEQERSALQERMDAYCVQQGASLADYRQWYFEGPALNTAPAPMMGQMM